MAVHLPFENTYARLPDRFYARVAPTPVRAPQLVRLNTELAVDLGLDPEWLAGHYGLEVLAGQRVPDSAEPIALAYAGHQFGHFVPQLGDGRAVLLGEIVDRHASGVMSSSRGRGPLRFHDAGTVGQRWDQCCASTL
jgi:serine/tyrosine/threonine adenylyltransferase